MSKISNENLWMVVPSALKKMESTKPAKVKTTPGVPPLKGEKSYDGDDYMEEEETAYTEEYQKGYDGGYEKGYDSGYQAALAEFKDKSDEVTSDKEGKRQEEEEENCEEIKKEEKAKPYRSKYLYAEEEEEEEAYEGVKGEEEAEEEEESAAAEEKSKKKMVGKKGEEEEEAEEENAEEEEEQSGHPKKRLKKKSRRLPVKRMVKAVKKMFGVNDAFDVKPHGNAYSENGVCVINIAGILGKEIDTEAHPEMLDIDKVTCSLKEAANCEKTKIIILDFDSPGGQVTGIEELGNLIKEIGQTKQIIAYTDTIIGSAAYWLASNCNAIICTPSSEIGSIGVFSLVEDHSERLQKEGIKVNAFFAGALKLLGLPFKPLTDEEKNWIQAGVDNQYAKFTNLVNENRGGVDNKYMQGQVFCADEALEANLVDMIVNDMDELISKIDTKD